MLKLSESSICYTRKLASDVLCVASVNPHVGDWSAYIGAISHEDLKNIKNVKSYGDKVPYNIAKVLFPTLEKKYSWRD